LNKNQKLVQEHFLDKEETILKRLFQVNQQSLADINGKVAKLQAEFDEITAIYDTIEDEAEKNRLKSIQRSKVYQMNYQKGLKKQVSDTLNNLTKKEYKTVSSYLNECYEDGFIGAMFDLQGQGIPLCMPIDQKEMIRAVQLNSKISKGLYQHLGENAEMLKKHITAQISRGISSGLTYDQIAHNLSAKMTGTYDNPKGSFAYAKRIVRTEGHRLQTESAMDAMYKAKEKGADVVKQWDSTLDGKTRPEHTQVDGEIRELDEEFSNGLQLPGDRNGTAAEVVNCRCQLLQRAKWALDDDELETLKKKAAYFGLDKTENFEEFKEKYLKAAPKFETPIDDLTNIVNNAIIVEGKNIVGEIDYQNSNFDYDIETALNAQGFDGIPQLVEQADFDEAVKKSSFIAQRTYTAPTKEIAEAYQKELYEGKWYVDCGTGGAQYGQGMYCAADYSGKLTQGIKTEMSHYMGLGKQRSVHETYKEKLKAVKASDLDFKYKITDEQFEAYKKYITSSDTMPSYYLLSKEDKAVFDTIGKKAKEEAHRKLSQFKIDIERDTKAYSYVETLTLQPDAKIFNLYSDTTEITNRYAKEYALKHAKTEEAKRIIEKHIELQEKIDSSIRYKISNDELDKLYEERNDLINGSIYQSEIAPLINKGFSIAGRKNEGALAVEMGYDAINAIGHGQSSSYTVVLNRTKCIFLKGGELNVN